MKIPRIRKKSVIIILLVLFAFAVIAAGFVTFTLPKCDSAATESIPSECMLESNGNYIAYQSGNECSAYASAYVMRHLGREISGEELYPEIKRIFGFVPVNSITNLFKEYGYEAQSCYGDIDTLKKRLSEGVPVIAFTSIENDTHYVAVVGYDEEFIYIADSIKDNANAGGNIYNRKLSIGEFENIWKTGVYPVDNIYIVISE